MSAAGFLTYDWPMGQKKPSRPFLLMAGLCLTALVVVDLLQVARPSGIAAAACVSSLFAGKPDAGRIIERHHETIVAQAASHDLPPELVAAVIADHQVPLTSFRVFTDCFGSALGANLSVGLVQMRLSTAALNDGQVWDDLTPVEYRQLRSRLLDPELNIAYGARELRSLLERKRRYPGIGADALIGDPFAMALTITEYRMGRLETDSGDSRLSADAFNALRLIADDMLDRFGRSPVEAQVLSDGIGAYLEQIYCQSGMFSGDECGEWRNRRRDR